DRQDVASPRAQALRAVAVDERGPQELQRPRQGEEAREPDPLERPALLPHEHRERLGEEPERHALREVEGREQRELERGPQGVHRSLNRRAMWATTCLASKSLVVARRLTSGTRR